MKISQSPNPPALRLVGASQWTPANRATPIDASARAEAVRDRLTLTTRPRPEQQPHRQPDQPAATVSVEPKPSDPSPPPPSETTRSLVAGRVEAPAFDESSARAASSPVVHAATPPVALGATRAVRAYAPGDAPALSVTRAIDTYA